jgi:hypothetical protein
MKVESFVQAAKKMKLPTGIYYNDSPLGLLEVFWWSETTKEAQKYETSPNNVESKLARQLHEEMRKEFKLPDMKEVKKEIRAAKGWD